MEDQATGRGPPSWLPDRLLQRRQGGREAAAAAAAAGGGPGDTSSKASTPLLQCASRAAAQGCPQWLFSWAPHSSAQLSSQVLNALQHVPGGWQGARQAVAL